MRIFKTALAMVFTVLATQGYGFDLTHILFKAVVSNLPHNSYSSPASKSSRSSAPGPLSKQDALALYSDEQRRHSFDACEDQFPGSRPLDKDVVPAHMKPLALCSDHFAVLYSQTSKTPLVVVERLTADQLRNAAGEERTNQFFPDPRIPAAGSAALSDYSSQSPAVDRGHNAPAADAPNQRAMAQSFSLSNSFPQQPTNNRKIWSKVEMDVRKFAMRARGNVFVFTGPMFDPGHETVGANKVWKPTRIFKLVYDEASGKAWAYIQANAETPIERPVDYRAFVATTGLTLLEGIAVTGSIGRSPS
jgi:endonuclease G